MSNMLFESNSYLFKNLDESLQEKAQSMVEEIPPTEVIDEKSKLLHMLDIIGCLLREVQQSHKTMEIIVEQKIISKKFEYLEEGKKSTEARELSKLDTKEMQQDLIYLENQVKILRDIKSIIEYQLKLLDVK